MSKKTLIWVIIVAIILIALFYIPKLTDPNRKFIGIWKDADIGCLPSHTNANLHIHPVLQISVDGKQERIPKNLGIVTGCMAEIHTHDSSGALHVESVSSSKTFTLSQFFEVWEGKTLEREGFDLVMLVGNATSTELGDLILEDKQQINLNYTKN